MWSSLDMSLGEIIKKNKMPSVGNFRGRGRGSGPGPTRRFPSRSRNLSAPYSIGKHHMYSGQNGGYPAPAAKAAAIETGTKLYISNLDYGVSNEDVKELFSEVGDLKHYSVHYDRSGRSKGTAEVVLSRRGDALAAVKRYNNVQLDGKPMKIEIVGTNIPTPAAVSQVSNGSYGKPNRVSKSAPIRGSIGRPRGGVRGRGRGRGRGTGRNEPISAAKLDADLEKYHSEAIHLMTALKRIISFGWFPFSHSIGNAAQILSCIGYETFQVSCTGF